MLFQHSKIADPAKPGWGSRLRRLPMRLWSVTERCESRASRGAMSASYGVDVALVATQEWKSAGSACMPLIWCLLGLHLESLGPVTMGAIMRINRLRDLVAKAWTQGLDLLRYPSHLPMILKWIAYDRVHPGELLALYPHRRVLIQVSPNTVIDVGANTGQFSSAIGVLLPAARIYAFEPIRECHERYHRRMKRRPETYLFEFAIGNKVEERILRVSEFSESSSLMKMSEPHKEAFPWTAKHTETRVQVTTLDAFSENLELYAPVLLKLDVQGYELAVLSGAKEVIDLTNIVIVETAFLRLYEEQPLFQEIHGYLSDQGFIYSGALQQILDPRTGLTLQADSLFLRK